MVNANIANKATTEQDSSLTAAFFSAVTLPYYRLLIYRWISKREFHISNTK